MQKKRSIKIISVVLILVLICILITYFKNDGKVVLATTREFNLENLQDNEHMHVEVDSSGYKVPVPNGYVGSKATGENEIDTGYVIYEGTEEVNDNNVKEAQKTRNQYVWIPVPDISKFYGTDANGKKWGKLYEFTTDTGDGIDPVTGAKPLNWSESDGVMSVKNGYREPNIAIPGYDIDSKIKKLEIEESTTYNFLIQLEKEFNNMIDSVKKYGGFYVGRYETGNLNKEKAVIIKGNTNIADKNWYVAYKKCKDLSNGNKNIVTGMIWGNQWDRTLIWLVESENKSKKDICVDSTNWGNYANSTFNYMISDDKVVNKNQNESLRIPTGSTEYSRANNIYDLAGNVWEWTIESFSNFRIPKGGSYYNDGEDFYSSISSNNYPTDTYDYPKGNYGNLRLSSDVIYKIRI